VRYGAKRLRYKELKETNRKREHERQVERVRHREQERGKEYKRRVEKGRKGFIKVR
jgi:hypothetical protein